jgi:hypothetical protein
MTVSDVLLAFANERPTRFYGIRDPDNPLGGTTVLALITQVRNLALEAELKGQKRLAAKLRAVADEEGQEPPARGDPNGSSGPPQPADRPPA